MLDRPLGAQGLALLGTIKLLRDELLVPAQDRVGLNHMRHFFQCLLAQLLAELGQSFALTVRQPYTARDLMPQDAILCHQILVA
jgi:hypothetical protein